MKKGLCIGLCLLLLCGTLLPSCSEKERRVPIIENGQSAYVIVIPERATAEEKSAAATLRNVIRDTVGVTLTVKDDWLKEGTLPAEKEILVGNTNRPESASAMAELPLLSWHMAEVGGKLVLCGRGDGALTEAIQRFLTDHLGYDPATGKAPKTDGLSVKEGVRMHQNLTLLSDHPAASEEAFWQNETESRLQSGGMRLAFRRGEQGYTVGIVKADGLEAEGTLLFQAETPAAVRVTNGQGQETEAAVPYNNVIRTSCGYTGVAEVTTAAGSCLRIRDDYYIAEEGVFALERTVTVLRAARGDRGYASLLSIADAAGSQARDAYEYFVPGLLFKDTTYMQTTNPWGKSLLSDLSGERSYVKEPGMPMTAVMARNTAGGATLMLQHLSPNVVMEQHDPADEILSADVRYGALGYSFSPTLGLDFVYPASEGPVNYEHYGSTWRRKYHPMETGAVQQYTLALIAGTYDSYQDAVVDTYKTAYRLENPPVAEVDVDTLYDYQIDIYDTLFTEYTSSRGNTSAGVYFDASVLTGKPFSPISYLSGFSGAQTAVAYELYREGLISGDASLKEKGVKMLNFWSSDTVNSQALPIVWWVPNQNAPLSGTAQRYANYLRVMVDSMECIWDAYTFGLAKGEDNTAWKKAVLKFADFLVDNQSAEGTWARCYNRNGTVNTTCDSIENFDSNTIFNGYDGASPLASYCAVRFLAKVYEVTGDTAYRDAALKTAEWAYQTLYVEMGKYMSICPDHVNIVDKESSIYAMYCFETGYALTGDEKYLTAWEHAAVCAMSFVYVHDFAVTYAANDTYAKVNVFKDGGVIGQSLIATGWGSVDSYASHIASDLFELYVITGDTTYLSCASFIQSNTKLASDYDGSRGWYLPGFCIEAANVNQNIFSTAGDGCWLPWLSHSFVDPMLDLTDRYGDCDVNRLAAKSLDDLRALRG